MKKLLLATAVIATSAFIGPVAKADVSLFNVNQQNLDSSLEVRQSTTEQFDPIRGQSVLDRPRPDFDPVPVPVGSFQLFPAINVGSYYDSNIFATRNNSQGDEVFKINPTATFASNWGRNAVAVTGLGDFNYYANNNEQNYQAGAVQAEGRYDIAQQTWISGVAGYQRVAEMRGGPLTPGNSLGPSMYDLYTGAAEAYRNVGIVSTQLDYKVAYYDYDKLQIIGGPDVNQNNRNYISNDVSGEAGYNMTQNFQPYVHGGYNWHSYTGGGINSSNGYAFDVGSKMDFGGITTAKAYVGYLSQNFMNYGSGDVGAIDFGADVLWNITGLTSLEGKAGRSIQESDTLGASSILASQGSVVLSHELRRNIVLQASAVYYALDYQQIVRHDDLYDAGAGLRYYINRHLYSDLTYDYQRRDSQQTVNDYERNVLFLRVGIQY